MLYVHEQNLETKIRKDYNHKGALIANFRDQYYLPTRRELLSLQFNENNMASFERATALFNNYYDQIDAFSHQHGITSQSKFASTFLEEFSVYLFKDIPEIVNEEYGVFNKKIYAGLKIKNDRHIGIITKDVDFCIGKKSTITIDGVDRVDLIVPIVAVEVKTYLDATMFGEIKSSSKAIRSASPNSRAYVLMGYKDLADEHIIAAKQDSTLTEMFALREDAQSPVVADAVYQYWKEIKTAIASTTIADEINSVGRLLRPIG